jgi:hypothetical protein
MTEVNLNSPKNTKSKPTKSKKAMCINNPPTRQLHPEIQIATNNYEFEGVMPSELQGNLKSLAILGMSFPAGNKKKALALNLHKSTYVNAYLSKYMCFDIISGLDDHSKFAITYGMNFIDALMTTEAPNIAIINKQQDQEKQNVV